MIENIRDLADHYGCKPSIIGRLIYRATECGCTFDEHDNGVIIAGYAEGSDGECESFQFNYPFGIEEFETQLELCDEEGCEAWREANTQLTGSPGDGEW